VRRGGVVANMPCENFLGTAVRARKLVENGEVVGKVLHDDGVVHSVVARSAEAERFEDRVPRVANFAVNEQKPAAVSGAKRSPRARIDPEAYAGGQI
jgi:hypothetical protein